MHADGATDWVQLDACLLESEDGDDPLVLAQVQDITQRRRQQEQLAELAIRDPLTGLLNQRGFRDALARECERAQRYQESVGLLILDLDNFKIVNDCTGHVAGDQALIEVADVLKARLRRTDLIGRQGGESSPPCCSASRRRRRQPSLRRSRAPLQTPTSASTNNRSAARSAGRRSARMKARANCWPEPTTRCTQRKRKRNRALSS